MRDPMERRAFLSTLWKVGAGLLATAAVWTSWDLFRPREATGSGGVVEAFAADALIGDDVAEVSTARSYLTRVGGEIVALSEVCTHLRCRVAFCRSSGRFECPCHGNVFNRAGDHLSGPAPRGLDRHPVQVIDGIVLVDTAVTIDGPPPGTVTIDEPAQGAACTGEEGV